MGSAAPEQELTAQLTGQELPVALPADPAVHIGVIAIAVIRII